ncbi:MAG: methyltransferase domain-containing protein, partial [Planctomycetaceae bacterium]|nr:methyltransferase domain-containing protein [Planctomycetaceae bacterium]
MVIVDVGCGDGGWMLAAAAAHPDRTYIGLELIAPLVRKAAAAAPPNATFIAGDAVAWLQGRAEGSVDEVHVYHPQPYYDPAEAHLGVGTPAFFERVWRVLKPGGRLLFQTDNRRYGKHLLAAAARHFDARVQPGRWPEGPRTYRESVAMAKKLTILRVVAARRA